MIAELSLQGVPASVPAARTFVRATLASWDLGWLSDSATVIVSELATNAVLHAQSSFVVRLALDAEGGVRLEVIDGSARQPVPKRHSAGATTGRGLSIVDQLASAWGVEERPDGKAVWVHLTTRVNAAGSGASVPPAPGGSGGRGDVHPSGPTATAA